MFTVDPNHGNEPILEEYGGDVESTLMLIRKADNAVCIGYQLAHKLKLSYLNRETGQHTEIEGDSGDWLIIDTEPEQNKQSQFVILSNLEMPFSYNMIAIFGTMTSYGGMGMYVQHDPECPSAN